MAVALLNQLKLCVLGPRLFRIYQDPSSLPPLPPSSSSSSSSPPSAVTPQTADAPRPATAAPTAASWEAFYQPRSLEKYTDSVLAWVSVLWSISYYTSPLAAFYLYRKGYLNVPRFLLFSQYSVTFLLLLAGVACLRGLGRWTNPQYVQFISILEETTRNNSAENKKKLSRYNFDFKSWPADFRWDEVSSSYLLAHSFGRRMVYPGSVYLLQKVVMPMLLQGQARLVEEYNGTRAKLVACDGNDIDTMFVDRRRSHAEHGKKLVICCEGNAGFYEIGCVATPLDAGYSILGWNHPGFAGSTGVPNPQNEANAMDVVIQYAQHRLGFQLEDIVIYAWSIGGFTGTWAAMSYPEIRGLVLDASFDDLVPLALKVMPESWRGLVTRTIRQYLNLNNAEQLCRYQGPVLLIRRTKDEIITTTVPEDVLSNRGNNLLLRLLQHRYPKVMTEEVAGVVWEWLGTSSSVDEASVYSQYEVDDDWCLSVLQSYKAEHSGVFPYSVGEDMTPEGKRQLALFLARKYLKNFDTTHCTPLPATEFQMPWSL